MITIRLLLQPGRPAQPVDALGRPLAVAIPGPVIGSAEPIRILFLDAELHAADPAGFADAPSLRLSIAQDLDPSTTPLYVTDAIARTTTGQYDLEDPSGTYTAEAVAALGVLPALPCVWEIAALDGDGDWAHPLGVVQAGLPLRNRADSLATPEPVPPADLRGPPGKDATIEVGETTTLPAGSSATVENVGTGSAAILNFGIPGSGGIRAVVWPPTGGGEKQVSSDALHDITFQTPLEVTATMTLVDIPQTGVHYWYFVLRNPSAYNVNLVWRPAASVDAGNNNSAFPAQITQKSVVYLLAASRNGLVVPLFAREVFSFYS